MIVLALDSTTPAGSVALGLRDGTVAVGDVRSGLSWSERLPGDLLALVEAHGLRFGDVDLFAVASGPGSLTGLRVGLATVQGLAFASGRPVVAISALDALAEQGAGAAGGGTSGPLLVGAWANAMRGEVFSALYEWRPAVFPADPGILVDGPSVERPERTAAQWRAVARERPLLAVGDVSGPLGEPLRAAFGAELGLVERPPLAGGLVGIARRRAARGELSRPHAVRPLYLRQPDAVLARDRARRGEDPPGRDGRP